MSLKIINTNYILKYNKMRQIIYLIIFLLGFQNICAACDLLDISIGGDKSEAEEYFGPIEIEEENKEIVYSKSFNHSTEAFIVEELLVSSPEYISSVIDNEPDDS